MGDKKFFAHINMATNKECLIIVLDIRSCSDGDFKLKSVKCVAEILKDKICSAKKDYVSFVLVGCEQGNENLPNIVSHPDTLISTWKMLLDFFKFVNAKSCDEGQWLDALTIAVEKIESAQAIYKLEHQRILLFYDFNAMPQNHDTYNNVMKAILKAGIDLIVGNHNIAYIDNVETSEPQAIFKSSRKATDFELETQKQVLQLVSNCNATLCNFKETLNTVFKVYNRRPWVWEAKLRIGSQVIISLQGFLAMKDESHINLKKAWVEADEILVREQHYFIKGTEITPMPEDLIDGYMLGGTAVPYDETLVEPKRPHPPGLHFVGFIKRNSVPDEYFCGSTLYTLVHQKGNTKSACKLDALVRALHQQERIILCWKIYSNQLNAPHIVVLIPNELNDERPASLSMLELSYHAQHHFWDFPALRTAKTECTEEQMQAVDNLIDSMDLECTLKDTQVPRQLRQNDLLPFDQLPSIYEQNVMDMLERKVICRAADDEQFQEMLQDKNFAEIFWKVPEPIEQSGKQAASKLQKLFPLEQSYAWQEKLKAKQLQENGPTVKVEKPQDDANSTLLTFESVGLVTPAQDFAQLLEHNVRTLQHKTERDVQFQAYASQMRVVILTLLERAKLNVPQLIELLTLYRNSCLEFNSFVEYNKFATELKIKALAQDLREFWQKVMVPQKLGPLVLGEPTLDDELRLNAYYTVQDWQLRQPKLEKDAEKDASSIVMDVDGAGE